MEDETKKRRERIDHFLRMLAKVADQFAWRIDFFNQIRAEHVEARCKFCPLTALAYADSGVEHKPETVHRVADELGLDDLAVEIVDAADLTGRVVSGTRIGMDLRIKIMKAVGLRD